LIRGAIKSLASVDDESMTIGAKIDEIDPHSGGGCVDGLPDHRAGEDPPLVEDPPLPPPQDAVAAVMRIAARNLMVCMEKPLRRARTFKIPAKGMDKQLWLVHVWPSTSQALPDFRDDLRKEC
jgi:hypothetical protein